MNAKPTPGPWNVTKTGRGDFDIVAPSQKNGWKPVITTLTIGGNYWAKTDYPPTQEANARLIVAVVNACFRVNPENPMAVAEALPKMAKLVDTYLKSLFGQDVEIIIPKPIIEKIRPALAKRGTK